MISGLHESMLSSHAARLACTMRTIALVSGKGGTGKTTSSTNLAVAAVEDGKTVLLLDLDQQPNAFGWFQARGDKTGLLVVPTHHAAIPQLITDAAANGLDYVIIDTPAKTDGGTAKAALEAADLVLIPCQPSAHDLRAIQDTVELCRARGVEPFVVLNEVETNSPLTEEARSSLAQMEIRVLPQSIGSRRAFKHTATDGRGVVEFEKHGKAAEEIRALYRALPRLHSKKKAKP